MSPSEKGLWRCDLTVFVAVNGNLVRFWNKSCKEKGLANLESSQMGETSVVAVPYGNSPWERYVNDVSCDCER